MSILKNGMSHRKMLIVRMQAWAYDHVINKHYPKAEAIAEATLRRFEVYENAESPGHWANHLFTQFVQDCEANRLHRLD